MRYGPLNSISDYDLCPICIEISLSFSTSSFYISSYTQEHFERHRLICVISKDKQEFAFLKVTYIDGIRGQS